MSGVVTGRSGYDAQGNMLVYQPPNATLVVERAVTYGPWITIEAGQDGPGPGVYEIGANSGVLRGQQQVTYRSVTISVGGNG